MREALGGAQDYVTLALWQQATSVYCSCWHFNMMGPSGRLVCDWIAAVDAAWQDAHVMVLMSMITVSKNESMA